MYIFFKAQTTVNSLVINPFTAMSHLKNTHKSVKFETIKPLCLLFLRWHVTESPLKRTTLKTDDTGPENLLFSGVSVHHSAQKLYRLGQ